MHRWKESEDGFGKWANTKNFNFKLLHVELNDVKLVSKKKNI